VQRPAGAEVFLVTFFSKKVTSYAALFLTHVHRFAFEKMDCFASLAMTRMGYG